MYLSLSKRDLKINVRIFDFSFIYMYFIKDFGLGYMVVIGLEQKTSVLF
jgi:hypothetical protein